MGFRDWMKTRLSREHSGKVLILGLDSAGKTTLTRFLKLGSFQETSPTIGQNIEVFKTSGWNITAIDVAGQRHFRFLWSSHYPGTNGVVFVVDAADVFRFEEARAVIVEHVLENEYLKGVPVLILANKQDIPGAVHASTLIQALGLHEELTDHTFQVFGCSVLHGEGVEDGLDWLVEVMDG